MNLLINRLGRNKAKYKVKYYEIMNIQILFHIFKYLNTDASYKEAAFVIFTL